MALDDVYDGSKHDSSWFERALRTYDGACLDSILTLLEFAREVLNLVQILKVLNWVSRIYQLSNRYIAFRFEIKVCDHQLVEENLGINEIMLGTQLTGMILKTWKVILQLLSELRSKLENSEQCEKFAEGSIWLTISLGSPTPGSADIWNSF